MVLRSKIGGKRIQKIFGEAFGNCIILARESGYRVLMAENQITHQPTNAPPDLSMSSIFF